jgi:hypothetical protein
LLDLFVAECVWDSCRRIVQGAGKHTATVRIRALSAEIRTSISIAAHELGVRRALLGIYITLLRYLTIFEYSLLFGWLGAVE